MRGPGEIVVVSCYELGHQPLAAASAIAFLERAGYRPAAVDVAVEGLAGLRRRIEPLGPQLAAVSVPMHTALHVGVRAAREVRAAAPGCHVCFYGLYATLNAEHLLDGIADSVAGGESESALTGLAAALETGQSIDGVTGLGVPGRRASPLLGRLDFPAPSRDGLPPLERYAKLLVDGQARPAAAIEASRGCLHRCRHCPIPPVYDGRFFVVPREVVLADVSALVARGVRHVSFADPDFFNGPGHSLAVVRALHERFPGLTFDVTTKVERILRRRRHLPELAASGCLFVVSAVESLSPVVLAHLDKGHTREDASAALAAVRAAGITLRPTFVAFTPWTTLADYRELLAWVEREELIDAVDPVQFAIRLLVPPGSPLVRLPAMLPHLGALAPERFSYAWRHPDPRMDRLQAEAAAIVEHAARAGHDAHATFDELCRAACAADGGRAGARPGPRVPAPPRPIAPRLSEPWFC